MKPKVLVTGGAGLLGTELCLLLRQEGYDVVAVDNLSRYALLGERGIRDENLNAKILKDLNVEFIQSDFRSARLDRIRPDAVVHAAAQVCHSRKGTFDNWQQDYQINVEGTLDLLEQCRALDIPMLFISSAKVYGENLKRPGREYDEKTPLGDQTHLTFFGASKVAADLACQMFHQKFETSNFKVGVFRPGCFTGPWALATEAQNWLPWFAHRIKHDLPITVFGVVSNVRDILHVSDLAEACLAWLQDPKGGVWNLGGGLKNSVTVMEAIRRMVGMTSKDSFPALRFDPARPGDIEYLVLSNKKFNSDFELDIPYVPLDKIFEELMKGTL